jgi:hypothetical protein
MREHGHLVPGTPQPLPCGWPGGLSSVPESPAVTLRRAASLLKERASAASKGPWKSWQEGRDHEGGDSMIGTKDRDPGSGDLYVQVGHGYHDKWEADQDYIASVHPLFGAAVAGWLDEHGRDAESAVHVAGHWNFGSCDDPPGARMALAAARIYLGETEGAEW